MTKKVKRTASSQSASRGLQEQAEASEAKIWSSFSNPISLVMTVIMAALLAMIAIAAVTESTPYPIPWWGQLSGLTRKQFYRS